jgi:hypothetical protein
MYFIENVISRRVYIYRPATKNSMGPQRNINTGQINSYRVVIALEEFEQGNDGLRVPSEITEEVNEILVAHT